MARTNLHPENVVHTVIIGAGPYGLSIAAHLAGRRVPFRIFGHSMKTWATQMPKGMRLKSEGFASSLSDPKSEYTLSHFCAERKLPYADSGLPVALETFVSYGIAFQKKFVPNLEDKTVVALRQSSVGFDLELENGERVLARNVVIAAGISHYAWIPPELAELPSELITHSSAHHDLEEFRGREVVVVGAGASALDLAALLHQSGANVQIVARSSTVRFHDPPKPRSLTDRILHPTTGLGAGMQLAFYVHAPQVFRRLPEALRLDRVRKVLGPAPGWFVRDEVVGKVPMHLDTRITGASTQDGRVSLRLSDNHGMESSIEAEHVISATGYRVDLKRLAFLPQEIRDSIRTINGAPALSAHFESSRRRLFFVGASAANTFGPLMRFAYGAEFTAKCVSRHLAKTAQREVIPSVQREAQGLTQQS